MAKSALLLLALLGAAQYAAAGHVGAMLVKHHMMNKEVPEVEVSGARCLTVPELLKADGNFSTLLAAVAAADLGDALSDPELEATIFAPTDDAFVALLKALKLKPEQLLKDKELVAQVLKYHVIPRPFTSAALGDGRKYPTLLTVDALEGGEFMQYKIEATKLTVDKTIRIKKFPVSRNVDVSIVPSGGPAAEVVVADLKACKAIVHVIDEVLVPELKPEKPKAKVAGVPSGISNVVIGPVEDKKKISIQITKQDVLDALEQLFPEEPAP